MNRGKSPTGPPPLPWATPEGLSNLLSPRQFWAKFSVRSPPSFLLWPSSDFRGLSGLFFWVIDAPLFRFGKFPSSGFSIVFFSCFLLPVYRPFLIGFLPFPVSFSCTSKFPLSKILLLPLSSLWLVFSPSTIAPRRSYIWLTSPLFLGQPFHPVVFPP